MTTDQTTNDRTTNVTEQLMRHKLFSTYIIIFISTLLFQPIDHKFFYLLNKLSSFVTSEVSDFSLIFFLFSYEFFYAQPHSLFLLFTLIIVFYFIWFNISVFLYCCIEIFMYNLTTLSTLFQLCILHYLLSSFSSLLYFFFIPILVLFLS